MLATGRWHIFQGGRWSFRGRNMKFAFVAGLVGMLVMALSGTSGLADGIYSAPQHRSAGYCFLMRRSPILGLPTVDDMRAAVEERYHLSVDVSLRQNTIFNRSPRFAWASEAKLACGKAIGYFRGREINEEMISKCDCYHGRMLSHMGR